jgi:hypothetical protein
MKLQAYFQKQADHYPTLYGNDHRAWIRAAICTMLSNGNGFEWQNGEFVNKFADEREYSPPDIPKERLEEITEILIRETNDRCPQISADDLPGEWCGLYRTPENITDEWLELVLFVFNYVFSASQYHFYFHRDGMDGQVEPTYIYNHTSQRKVKHHFWVMYQGLRERCSRVPEMERPQNAYCPFDTKEDRERQAEIVRQIMNEIWQKETGEQRY